MQRKYTKETIIDEFRKVHGNKYDYSKINYQNTGKKITIICPIHGEFEMKPSNHLNGQGCKECGKITKNNKLSSNTEKFIKKAKEIHKNRYDYSKVEYKNSQTKVIVKCPEHGEFLVTPNNHLRGRGCKYCGIKKVHDKQTYTKEQFIEKAIKVHNNKYDYSKVKYINANTKITIICPIHGEFKQTPASHLQGCGCDKCGVKKRTIKRSLNSEQFIEKARKVHRDKYDYTKVIYVNAKTPVTIICHEKDEFGEEHGEFTQIPDHHLRGHGCDKCSKNKPLTTEEFIKKANKIHNNKYDYTKVEYINTNTLVTILCPFHNEFPQIPHSHLSGNGCPKCNQSHLEIEMRMFLQENNIIFEEQKRFEWLGKQSMDFYLPDYNIAIECQGEQHFHNISYYNNKLLENQLRDTKKFNLCKEHNIPILYYIPKKEWLENCKLTIYNKENTFFSTEELIKHIKQLNKTND